MSLSDFSKPEKTLWQRYKSALWVSFKCLAVWFVAKGLFVLIYAASGRALTPSTGNVILVAALVPVCAWYFWRYVPRRAGQLADRVEPSHGAMTIRWGQGLLRLWLVLTVLWVGAAGLIVWQDPTSGRGLTDEEIGIA